jgi:lipopolysaccharide transport protein LptA
MLTGDVLLKGPGDLELRSDRIGIRDNSNLLISRDSVKIRYGNKFSVVAGRMQVSLKDEHFVLSQGTRTRSLPEIQPPVSLDAQRLVYERKAKWLHVEGGADLRRGADRLRARRLSVQLADDEQTLEFVRALFDVEGQTHSTVTPSPGARPQPTTVRFSGNTLAALLRPQSNEVRRVELDGDEKRRATLVSTTEGLVRTLTAKRIEGVLSNGVVGAADAFGGVEIRETAPKKGATPAIQRLATGRRGQATFTPEGQLATFTLDNSVVFKDGTTNAAGNRATLDLEKSRGEFFGNPVVVINERGKITAPRIVYNTDQKIINARGGVKAALDKVQDTSLGDSPLSSGEGPVNIESQEAFWRNAPPTFLFRGDVRAWQGENLLLAPELRGDRDQDQLNASGGVKTLLVQKKDDAKPGRANVGGPTNAAARRTPIQVTGRDLEYRKKQGIIVYTGNVRVDQEGKILTCQRLEVELDDEKHQAKSMVCTGDVKMNDPKEGRLIEGQKAVYNVDARRIDITGEPVVMSDREGNKVRGRTVAYFIDDGKAEVKGKESTP